MDLNPRYIDEDRPDSPILGPRNTENPAGPVLTRQVEIVLPT